MTDKYIHPNNGIMRAAKLFIVAKSLNDKMRQYSVDLAQEVRDVSDEAIDVICGTNSRATEFIFAFYAGTIDINALMDALTTDEEYVNEVYPIKLY